jgi:hypothetical protein
MISTQRISTDLQDATTNLAPLSREELAQVHGGAIRVMVDGRTPATVDDFALNMEIFKGNIGGPVVL